eukprot:SAG31_NODE_3337_length_4388_cov_3.372814_3_plen_81_part_00
MLRASRLARVEYCKVERSDLLALGDSVSERAAAIEALSRPAAEQVERALHEVCKLCTESGHALTIHTRCSFSTCFVMMKI